jgi:hypothetical protein
LSSSWAEVLALEYEADRESDPAIVSIGLGIVRKLQFEP